MAGKLTVKKVKKPKAVRKDRRPRTMDHRPLSVVSRQADAKRQLQIQKALYEIADAASAVKDMQSFYKKLHKIVGKLMYAENFFVALYDEQTDLITWPYHADVVDKDDKFWSPQSLTDFKGGTAYIIRTGTSTWMARDFVRALNLGEVELVGTKSVDSLGIPLKDGKRVLGAIVVQSYSAHHVYTEQDEEVLSFVAQHISTALTRARALEAERQRTDELAIINSVQTALASQLDFQSIVDSVGEKITEIFDEGNVGIGFLDTPSGLFKVPYLFENGKRVEKVEFRIGERGLTSHMFKIRRPLIINTEYERISKELGALSVSDASDPKSWLAVPILVNDEVIGAFSLQNWERENAYTDSDVRLLQTLAGSLGIALQNARLFKAEQERVAELAVINSVQEGLASKLDMQAIYDLVGDKISEIFNAQSVAIGSYDHEAGLVDYRYAVQKGRHLRTEIAPFSGMSKHMINTRRTLVMNENVVQKAAEIGSTISVGDDFEWPRSAVYVPLLVGETVTGVISIGNMDRENAFSSSDVRLLETLANSMSVALENARLFDETQRLLKETEQRVAELAVINSVQEGLASKLDMQAIFDLVGDKIRDMFNAQSVLISSFDHEKQVSRLEYAFEDGQRVYDDELLPFSPLNRHMIETRQAVVINENSIEESNAMG